MSLPTEGSIYHPRILLALKGFVTLALLAWLFWQADWGQLVRLAADLNPGWLLLSLVFHLLAFLIYALRWTVLVGRVTADISLRRMLPVIWLGLFANNFMPAGTGPDVAKILAMRSDDLSGKTIAAVVLVERLIGLAGVVAIGAVALLLWAPPGLAHLPAGLLLLVPLVLFALILLPFGSWMVSLLNRSMASWAVHLADALRVVDRFRTMPGTMAAAFGLTVLLQSLVVLAYAALGIALDVQAPLVTYFVAIPVVFLMVSLPLSIGGLGVREGTFVAVMVAAGMAEQPAIAISVLFLFELLILTLPGGLLLMRRGLIAADVPIGRRSKNEERITAESTDTSEEDPRRL